MQKLAFVTTNPQKFLIAEKICDEFGVAPERKAGVNITEVQSESGETVAMHKAHEAFRLLQRRVVVTDDTWIIPGLRGFPGPYMSSINQWLTVEDWLRLTRDLVDRRVVMRQIVAY